MDNNFKKGFEKVAKYKTLSTGMRNALKTPKGVTNKAKTMPMKKHSLRDLGGMFGPGSGM